MTTSATGQRRGARVISAEPFGVRLANSRRERRGANPSPPQLHSNPTTLTDVTRQAMRERQSAVRFLEQERALAGREGHALADRIEARGQRGARGHGDAPRSPKRWRTTHPAGSSMASRQWGSGSHPGPQLARHIDLMRPETMRSSPSARRVLTSISCILALLISDASRARRSPPPCGSTMART